MWPLVPLYGLCLQAILDTSLEKQLFYITSKFPSPIVGRIVGIPSMSLFSTPFIPLMNCCSGFKSFQRLTAEFRNASWVEV